MTCRIACVLSALAVVLGGLLAPGATHAQQRGKVLRIGYLILAPLGATPSPEREAFLTGLSALGYVDGRTIAIEYRSAAWNRDLLDELAAELVDLKVDLIFAPGLQAVLAAQKATRTIPIVMTELADPVGSGLVASLSRPGGNITGVTMVSPQLGGKRLELLREVARRGSRIAVIWNPVNPATRQEWQEMQAPARVLGITLQSLTVSNAEELLAAFSVMAKERPAALLTILDPLMASYRQLIAEFALKQKLPTSLALREFAEDGGLMSYGPSVADMFRRAASYVDRVLKGAKPADLPVEQPTKFELVINLKTAQALGLNVPPSLVLRADHVIR